MGDVFTLHLSASLLDPWIWIEKDGWQILGHALLDSQAELDRIGHG